MPVGDGTGVKGLRVGGAEVASGCGVEVVVTVAGNVSTVIAAVGGVVAAGGLVAGAPAPPVHAPDSTIKSAAST
ncbi:MAG TPA: hypothetical protein VFX19_13740 [Dehalococcoidia bacterium]|nr:hypothetical protein [Dehalococcoidia bacterium]